MRNHTPQTRTCSGGIRALLLAAVTAMVALAGCLDAIPGGDGPEAVLVVDDEEAWASETVKFDGAASTPPEQGEIVHWRFEFGDGSVHEADDRDDAVYEHEYEHGGVYTALLIVTAEYENGDNRSDATERTITVHERFEIDETVGSIEPLNLSLEAEQSEVPFDVYDRSSSWELELQVQNNDPLGTSEFTVRILDDANEAVEEETRQLDGGENATIQFSGSEPVMGNYTFELVAESGSVSAEGHIEVFYHN